MSACDGDCARRLEALEDSVEELTNALKAVMDTPMIAYHDIPLPRPLLRMKNTAVVPVVTPKRGGKFSYHPLDTARDEFRVIALRANPDKTAAIDCDLLHVSLEGEASKDLLQDRDPVALRARRALSSFRTLSYTWGNMDRDAVIYIDGKEFMISRTLEETLRNMREFATASLQISDESFWWVDAISINQEDVIERNSQVLRMTKIFRASKRVHVWLGKASHDSGMAFDLVRQLASDALTQVGPGDAARRYPEVSNSQKKSHWQALLNLFGRPWWERVWVRQEIALPTSVYVHCGDDTCDWDQIIKAAKILCFFVDELRFHPFRLGETTNSKVAQSDEQAISWISPFERAVLLDRLRHETGIYGQKKYIDFEKLLAQARSCQATDLRDKAYSMLGLVDPELTKLVPDYRLPLNEVYKDVARALIPQGLDFLSACQNPERRHGLPSWAPNLAEDLRSAPISPVIKSQQWLLSGMVQAQGGSRLPSQLPRYHFDESSNILTLSGVVVDWVKKINEKTFRKGDNQEHLAALEENWRRFVSRAGSDSFTTNVWETFLQVASDSGNQSAWRFRPAAPQFRGATVDDDPKIRLTKGLLLPEGFNVPSAGQESLLSLRQVSYGRRMSISERGLALLVPADASPGDIVTLFPGASLPYLLREQGEYYVVVGEACK